MVVNALARSKGRARGCVFLLISGMGQALAAPESALPEASERITVVGSHIPQVEAAGISPVLTIDRAAIERTGSLYLSEVLQQLPFDNAGTFNDRDPLSSALGGSGLSLRGLGADSVLVLINGRRTTTYGFPQQTDGGALASFVDLNSIPLAAVERVELLRDGASAMYGSDAVAGVLNIVLRDRYEGVALQGRFGGADSNDAQEKSLSALYGWAGTRSNLELIASYSKRDDLPWRDRDVSASANHESAQGVDLRDLSASNFLTDVGLSAFGADCERRNGDVAAFSEAEDGICLFDPNPAIVQPSIERVGLTLIGNHSVSPTVNLHVEASYLNSDLEGRLEPAKISGATFPSQNPWNPFGQDALAYYTFAETGPRISKVDTDNYRAVAALDGELQRWNWELGGLYHRARSRNNNSGQPSSVAIQNALEGLDLNNDGVLQDDEYLNLFSPTSNPNPGALIDSLVITNQRTSETELANLFAKLVGGIWDLPAGEVTLAIGLDYLYESLDDRSDRLSIGSQLAGVAPPDRYFGLRVDKPFEQIDPYAYVNVVDVPGFRSIDPYGSSIAQGSRHRNAVYTELQIPVLPRMRVQAALRYDKIDGFGGELSPRIALRFDLVAGHRLRGAWGQGFRAPSLAELNIGPTSEVQASWDPELCPEPGFLLPFAGGCAVKSFLTVQEGNRHLEPETSESWTLGIASDWRDELRTSVDCWRVTVDDRIVALGPDRILRNEPFLGADFVERLPPDRDQLAAGLPGYTDVIHDRYTNAASQRVRGCDVELDVETQSDSWGTFGGQLIGSHMASNKLTVLPTLPGEELAGTFGFPKWRANLNLFWQRARWRAGIQGRYTDGFKDATETGNVDSHTVWDTQFGVDATRRIQLTVGIENLFDKDPPSGFGRQGFPQQLYDMRGRFFYASLNFETVPMGAPRGSPR